ncbi:MAG TPA: tetratricopeptide repeat protein [Sphingomonas sp.]|nr:tetratricopeptide repeat protein [Sphingomonas sp.]
MAALLAVAGCRSPSEKAAAYEAQYDRMMANQAYPAALATIRKAIDADDSSPGRYIKLAEAQMALKNPAGAAPAFQSALDLEPDNIQALENLSILAVRGGQYETARRYIDPLLSLAPNDPAGLLASGAIALGEKRYKDAVALSDKIIGVLPGRPDGYVLKARALDNLGQTRPAITLLEARVGAGDDDRDVLFQLMAFYQKTGDKKGIRATAIRLMPLYPNDPRYAFEAARAYHHDGKPDQVNQILTDLEKRFATYPDVMRAIGNFWRETQPLPEARRRIAALAASSNPRVRGALANQLTDFGDPKTALGLLAPIAPATVTQANIDIQTYYARALLATGQTAKAQSKVDAILAFDRGNPAGLLIRARLKLKARDFRGAFTDAQLVTNDDNQNEEAVLLVAQIYAAQGNQLLAAGAYGNARRQFPGSLTALMAEINWLLGQNRTEEAAERAVSFYHAHERSSAAIAAYRTVCKQTRARVCQVENSGLLTNYS